MAQKPLISIDPYTRKKVAIIVTGTEVYEGRITDRFIPLISKKIKTYDAFVTSATIVPDNHQRIVNEISRAMELADLVCITGGTSVDPDDITLSAITSSGASVVRQGVPRQPGNHLSIAYHPQATLVTVPAGALSVPCSTFDTYLPRLLADHRITADELATSAAGGLCQQCPSCHFPNCTFGAMR
nr:molybdopterin-binding protein [Desulfurispira natronophila]